MNRLLKLVIGAALVVAVVATAAFLYLTRPLASASQDVQSSAEVLEVSADAEQVTLYRIAQDASRVTFELDEVLNGVDTHVVGATSDVAGDILVDFSDPSQTELGEIRINARTLATDSDRRNSMIGRFILQSETDANEFITFTPTSLGSLPDVVVIGSEIDFQITGDLTIAGQTNPVTFDASAVVSEDDQLIGSATATVLYADFGISIPEVPSVADVSDEVILTIEFVANAVTADTAS